MNEILRFMEGSKKILMLIIGSALPFIIGLNGIPFGSEKLAESNIARFVTFPSSLSNLELVFYYSLAFSLISTKACLNFWDFKYKHDMDSAFAWGKAVKRLRYKYVFSIINYGGSILAVWAILYLWFKRAKIEIEALMEANITSPDYDSYFYRALGEQGHAMDWILFAAIIAVPYIGCYIGFYTAEPTFRSKNN